MDRIQEILMNIQTLYEELEIAKKESEKESKSAIRKMVYFFIVAPVITIIIHNCFEKILDAERKIYLILNGEPWYFFFTAQDTIEISFFAGYGIPIIVLIIVAIFKKIFSKNKNKKINWGQRKNELDKEIEEKIQMLYDSIKQYYCDLFNITLTKLNVELDMIFRQHPTLKFANEQKRQKYKSSNSYQRQKFQEDWYFDIEVIETIQELLEERLGKKQYNADKEKDLSEYRKKRNENLDIKNQTMKPWECEYCGNINPPNEYSCIKCGAGRIK